MKTLINWLLFIGVVTVNALANILPINGYNTGQISAFYPNYFVPAGFTFSIWGLIYLFLLCYSITHTYFSFKQKEFPVIKKYLDKTFPNEEWIAEDSFCADAGYGGKIDLYSKSGIFVDFKTKDNLKGKDPAKLVFDEHGMQLSAYAQGCGFDDVERVSIFVDRKDTGLILPFVWDRESQSKHLGMFNAMLTYWKLVKNYDSSRLVL